MTRMPVLETERLIIRPFVMSDLHEAHHLLDIDLAEAEFGTEGAATLQQRREWLQWSELNHVQLARLYQPPYGDRAMVLKDTSRVIGACGLVPSFGPFLQLPGFSGSRTGSGPALFSPEIGLLYAVSPAFQRRGYAVEATRALIEYAFREMRVQRIVATTQYANAASMSVMQKLGMRIERNPYPEPSWFQVVGVLPNPAAS